MNIMLAALSNAGLVSETERNEAYKAEAAETEESLRELVKRTAPTVAKLELCASLREFREIAKGLLYEDSGYIRDIIKAVHRFKGQDGADKLIWIIYQVRDILPALPTSKKEQFLNRALRRSNPTVEIPL